jgi:diguanylate cyclase (GGDEF)-like protein/PAS domain S-box-containing protein
LVLIAANALENALRHALIESRQRYHDLVHAASDFVWETDRHGRFVFLSAAGALGYETRDMLGRPASDFVVDASPLPFPVFQAREPVLQADVWLQRADGTISCQSITAVPVYDPDGVWSGTRGMGRDVTEARENERLQRQRHLRDRLMNYLSDTIRDHIDPEKTLPAALSGIGLAIGADGGMILKGSPELKHCDVMPWGEGLPEVDLAEIQTALVEQGAVDLLRDGWQVIGHVTMDTYGTVSRVNGAVLFWCRIEDGGFGDGDRAILSDVAGQVGLAIVRLTNYREIIRHSNTDSLTGLLNRRAFFGDLRRRLRRLLRSDGTGTLVYIDVNNLKALNDAAGHAAGDRALVMLADILRQATRPTDLIARIGGDEYIAWLEGVGLDDAPARAEALLQRCQPLAMLSVVPDRPLGVSLGVAAFHGAAPESMEQLVARADAAMYEAKASRQNSYIVAQPAGSADVRTESYAALASPLDL